MRDLLKDTTYIKLNDGWKGKLKKKSEQGVGFEPLTPGLVGKCTYR